MEEFFTRQLGVSPELFTYLIVPLLIFIARISDVTLSTLRIIFVMSGRKNIAPILGFFEAFIWLLAISQIIKSIDNVFSYIAYAGGFATGTLVGMLIEEKLALGRVVVRIIMPQISEDLLRFFKKTKYRYSIIDGAGNDGKVNILFTVIKRDQLKGVLDRVQKFAPDAYFTVEGVKRVSEDGIPREKYGTYRFHKLWSGVFRK